MKKLTHMLILLCLCLAPAAYGHQHDKKEDKRDFAITKLSDNIHVLIGVNGFTGGNIALLTGEDGVIMIDDSMPPLGDKLKAAIKKVTPGSVDFIINTHVHADHTAHNAMFAKEGSWIIGHDNLRKHMAEKGFGMGTPVDPKALPVITFDNQMTFHLNGQDAKVIHIANAHTNGDAIIHYEKANIIHTGDIMFNKLFPYIDYNSGGSLEGYINGQKKILSLTDEKTTVIPGHGEVATPADLQASIDMLEDSSKIIKALIDEGLTEDEVVAKNPLQKYHDTWNWGFIHTERMTRQIYNGVK